MRRLIVKLLFLGAAGAVAGATATSGKLAVRVSETRVVPPLADAALIPGVTRCTSDGVATVTDEFGTRRGTPLVIAP